MPLDCKVRSTEPELVLYIHGHGKGTLQDVDTFASFFYKHLNKKEPFKVFYDLREISVSSIDFLKELIKHVQAFEELSPGIVIASSILVSGITVESLLNFIFSMKKPVTPTKVTANIQEACDFLNQ